MPTASVANQQILSIGFQDQGGLPPPLHNAHIVIKLRQEHTINPQKLLAKCLALEGVIERGSHASANEIAFGTIHPAYPPVIMATVLVLLHKEELLSEQK